MSNNYLIEPFYYYGQRIEAPAIVQALAARILDAADYGNRARLAYHAEDGSFYSEWHYARWSLVILDAHTGIGAEALDYSNADAIAAMHTGDFDALDLHRSGMRTMLLVPLTDEVEAELFPPAPEEWEAERASDALAAVQDALETAEHFADYPVLDEEDFSRREWEEWQDALADAVRWYPGEDIASDSPRALAIAEWISENYYGSAEPGYVATEWVAEAIAALDTH